MLQSRSGIATNKLDLLVPYILFATGLIGGIASFVLTYDKIKILQNPAYDPSCNINPILSCGSVMKTEQASLMGVPNTVFGLIAFSMLLTFAALLVSGVHVKKGIWLVAQLAATLGVIFMHYLFFQGVYRINAICPWCFVVWMVTIPTFWYITIYNLKQRNIVLPNQIKYLSRFLQRHHGDILIVWYLVIVGILVHRFWYYWVTLI